MAIVKAGALGGRFCHTTNSAHRRGRPIIGPIKFYYFFIYFFFFFIFILKKILF